MAAVRIWIAAAHDRAHQNGGWAFVRAGEGVTGWAGGDRRTSRARMALVGLSLALKGRPAGATLAVIAPLPDARVLHALRTPPDTTEAEADLRAALMERLAGVAWSLAQGDPASATPLAFAAAWADLSSGKARTGGAFTAAIPRPNLAKVAGL